ncbi:hypothetical protein VPNG_03303 [Cytospora leucostoma]|uniref:AB hydrolase-1 domain-containing protein n=1 Tax=Cytospora leucostoma TaxID=1230097 RepID=A0A423XFJ8_9PEZI|nr:hypothetical protein VPNG_03303 [Cytospora leucostoma]
MPSTKPVLVLVPGAWTPPQSYHKLVSLLEGAPYNFTVHVPALASNNGAQAPNTFEADVAGVRAAIEPLVAGAGEDVILLLHSYGGAVGSSAAAGLSRKERAAQGLPGGVAHLVYISAYLLAGGQSPWDVLVLGGGDTPERRALVDIREDGTWLPKDAVWGLYHDLEPEDQEEQRAGIRPHFLSALLGKATYEAWRDVPSTYVYTTEDRWDICLANAKKAGVHVDVVKFSSAHAPYIKHREEIAELVAKAAANLNTSPSRLPKPGVSTIATRKRAGTTGSSIGDAPTTAKPPAATVTKTRSTSGLFGRSNNSISAPSKLSPASSKLSPTTSTRPSASETISPRTATNKSTHTRAKSSATSLTTATVLRPPRPPSAGSIAASTSTTTTTAPTTATAASRKPPARSNTVTTRSATTTATQRQVSGPSSTNKSAAAALGRSSSSTITASRPTTTRSTATADDNTAPSRLRPTFSTFQQHYTPAARNPAPKPPTSSYLAPPTPSRLPASVAASDEAARLQAELLQLHLLHRGADAVSAAWRASARERLGRRREAGGLGALMGDDGTVAFVGELDPAWRDEVASMTRKLDLWRRQLGQLGSGGGGLVSDDGGGDEGKGQQQPSSLARILAGCREQVDGMLAELDVMGRIERDALAQEMAWVRRMNRDDDDEIDTPRAGAIWRAF